MRKMNWLKLKSIAAMRMAPALACIIAPLALAQTTSGNKMSADEIAAKSRAAYAALSSYSDNGKVVSEMGNQKNTLSFKNRLQRPNLYRVIWMQGAGPEEAIWSDGTGDFIQTKTTGQEKNTKPGKLADMKKAFSQATGPSWSAASMTAGVFFNQDLGDLFGAPVASGRYPLQKEPDGKVGDVDCYVVSCVVDLSKQPEKAKSGTATTSLWIGKKDFLIQQCRTKYVEKVDSSGPPSDQAVDEAIKKSLEMQKKPVTPEAIAAGRPQMRAIMKQVQSTLKSGFEAGVVFTQTHENISVNKKFATAEFSH